MDRRRKRLPVGRGRYKLSFATGGAHLFIPRAWMEHVGTEPGNYVRVTMTAEGELIVEPEEEHENEENGS
jgi:hypothetical protein